MVNEGAAVVDEAPLVGLLRLSRGGVALISLIGVPVTRGGSGGSWV